MIELAVEALEVRVIGDRLRDIGVGQAEAHAARGLVEGRFGDHLLQHLPVEPELARLLGGQRPAELAADLLQPVGVEIAELLGGNLRAADRGKARLSVSLEDVGDAPDGEADDQHAEHERHDRLAEPIR